MNLNKFLGIAVCSLLVNNSYAHEPEENISIVFQDNGRCILDCKYVTSSLKSIDELSRVANCFFGKYFTVDSIEKLPYNNNMVFKNFNTTYKSFSLSLAGNVTMLPDIMFECYNNTVKFPVINCLYDINHVYIYANSPHDIDFPISMVSPDVLSKCYINGQSII